MIQRIQSIYLLLVTALMAIFLFLPFAHTQGDSIALSVQGGLSTANGEVLHTWGLLALNAIIAVVAFITIFLYKNRSAQARLCLINALFMVTLYVVIFLYIYTKELTITLSPTIVIPAVAILFDWLACRAIKKDEKLVRSLDRVR